MKDKLDRDLSKTDKAVVASVLRALCEDRPHVSDATHLQRHY